MADSDRTKTDPKEPERRDFLGHASRAAMGAGLLGGYGAFGAIAGRFLYPAGGDARSWQFVTEVGGLRLGESVRFRAPAGETINITRQGEAGTAEDFVALSSTCPHLGCQVHWEAAEERYFCPCHNGTFDAAGVGTGGPPGDAGQSLPKFPLEVQDGVLFVLVRTSSIADARGELIESGCVGAAGHDPCLAGRPAPRRRPCCDDDEESLA